MPESILPQGPQSRFLCLPVELRLKIYRYCLVSGSPVRPSGMLPSYWNFSLCGTRENEKSLLLVNRQIGNEALHIFYNENTFLIDGDDDVRHIEQPLTTSNHAKIKKPTPTTTTPEIQQFDITLEQCVENSKTFWICILPNLTHLTIVTRLNFWRLGDYYDSPNDDPLMPVWLDWIRLILPFFAQHLRTSCVFNVDDSDHEETRRVVRKAFTSGYREIQTHCDNRRGEICVKQPEGEVLVVYAC